jgi:hypothetical protein
VSCPAATPPAPPHPTAPAGTETCLVEGLRTVGPVRRPVPSNGPRARTAIRGRVARQAQATGGISRVSAAGPAVISAGR